MFFVKARYFGNYSPVVPKQPHNCELNNYEQIAIKLDKITSIGKSYLWQRYQVGNSLLYVNIIYSNSKAGLYKINISQNGSLEEVILKHESKKNYFLSDFRVINQGKNLVFSNGNRIFLVDLINRTSKSNYKVDKNYKLVILDIIMYYLQK